MDPELEDLLDDQDLLRTARLVRAARPPQVDADPAFRSALRRELMRQAWDLAEPSMPWWRRLLAPSTLAWAGATVGALLIAIVTYAVTTHPSGTVSGYLVGSNLQYGQQAGVAQAIDLSFSQPMDQSSVQSAISIEPATQVAYQWITPKQVKITPLSGTLAPNTQYQITVAPSARTATGLQASQPKTVTLVTQAPPSPTPAPSPSPTPASSAPLATPRQLVPVGAGRAVWAADGSGLYLIGPTGQLEFVPAQGGEARQLVADGVRAFALSPDGKQVGLVRSGRLQLLSLADARIADLGGADASTVAWQQSRLLYVAGKEVLAVQPVTGPGTGTGNPSSPGAAAPGSAGTGRVATLSDVPTASSFSPAADRLAYQAGGALHLLDLGSGRDSVVSPTGAPLLGWSPDGRQLALGGDGVHVTNGSAAPAKVASLLASSLDWSSHGDLLLAVQGAVYQVRADGSDVLKLGDGEFLQPLWSPNATSFAFVRSGSLWTVSLNQQAIGGTAPSLEEGWRTVDAFIKARMDGSTESATAFLDPTARAAYSNGGLTLLYTGDERLGRYFVVYAEPVPGEPPSLRFTVRLVLARDKVETSTVDETLTLQRDATAKLLVHRASGGQRRPLGRGPGLLSMSVSPGQVQLSFDSDLELSSVAAGIVLKDSSGRLVQAQAAPSVNRTVTLAAPGLVPGSSYQVNVLTSLADVSGHPVASEYEIDFIASSS